MMQEYFTWLLRILALQQMIFMHTMASTYSIQVEFDTLKVETRKLYVCEDLDAMDTISVPAPLLISDAGLPGNYQWMDCASGAVVPGATETSFNALADGEYAVILELNGCVDTSECVQMTWFGLEENPTANLLVYPNPVSSLLNIDLEGQAEYSLMNLQGLVAEPQGQIDFSKVPDGMYLLNMKQEHGISLQRIRVLHE